MTIILLSLQDVALTHAPAIDSAAVSDAFIWSSPMGVSTTPPRAPRCWTV